MAGIGSERDTADLAAFHACLVVRGIPAIHADVAVTADRFAGRRMRDWGFYLFAPAARLGCEEGVIARLFVA